MKLGNWIAALGCLGVGAGVVLAGQGCTATLSVGSCGDAGCVTTFPGDDSSTSFPDTSVPQSDASVPDTGSTPPDPCNSCLYGQCVSAYSNCVANASCLTIYQCATSPACSGDGGCVQDCYNAGTPTAQTLYIALGDCDLNAECPNPGATCASVCNQTCTATDAGPGVDSAAPDDAGADAAALPCAACTQASCSTQLSACAAGTECATYNQCLGGCSTANCDTACQTAFAQGYQAATALGTCTTTNCPQCFN